VFEQLIECDHINNLLVLHVLVLLFPFHSTQTSAPLHTPLHTTPFEHSLLEHLKGFEKEKKRKEKKERKKGDWASSSLFACIWWFVVVGCRLKVVLRSR